MTNDTTNDTPPAFSPSDQFDDQGRVNVEFDKQLLTVLHGNVKPGDQIRVDLVTAAGYVRSGYAHATDAEIQAEFLFRAEQEGDNPNPQRQTSKTASGGAAASSFVVTPAPAGAPLPATAITEPVGLVTPEGDIPSAEGD